MARHRYYFFFSNSATHPLLRLFKDGFRHVEMITDFETGALFHINPRLGRVDHGITTDWTLPQIIAKQKELGRVCVFYSCNEPDPVRFIWRGFAITCASYLAYTIGISFRGVTPYQFYKLLISRGGEEI